MQKSNKASASNMNKSDSYVINKNSERMYVPLVLCVGTEWSDEKQAYLFVRAHARTSQASKQEPRHEGRATMMNGRCFGLSLGRNEEIMANVHHKV